MKVSYFLTRPLAKDEKPSDRETSIYARICYAGFKFKYYTPESINPKFWNKETRRAKETAKFREYPEFNARLNNIASEIKSIYRCFINDNKGVIPSPATLKKLLDKEIKKIETTEAPAITFFELFDSMIQAAKSGVRLNAKTGRPLSSHTCKTMHTIFTHLSEYQKVYKREINFNTIDLDFYQDYTEYLIKGKRPDKKTGKLVPIGLSTNTIGKHIQIIKEVLREASEKGIAVNAAFKSKRFKTVKEKTDSIYLNEKELKALEALELTGNDKMERVRDLFLIGCYTGLRYSDFSILKPENINDGFIKITQTKTGDPVVIPVHPTVKNIISKYNGHLPKSISNQKTNEYLKQLGQVKPAGKDEPVLNTPVTKTLTKGGTKVLTTHKKWELLTTHTARRSFATNEYLAGTPSITIMAITGHKSEKTFLGYIKLTSSEHAKLLELHWKKRHGMTAV